jgi:hypothetical protein
LESRVESDAELRLSALLGVLLLIEANVSLNEKKRRRKITILKSKQKRISRQGKNKSEQWE